MQARATRNLRNASAVTISDRIDRAILWLTLAALFMIPLTFSYFRVTSVFTEPRLLTLHLLAGLVLILWIWQITLQALTPDSSSGIAGSWDLNSWAGRNPARWAIVTVGALAIVQVASTLLSPLPIVSFFGGDEARTGYNLYDSFSMLVIFFSVALRFRSRRHLELLVYVLVASGTVAAAYGIAQHFGWDPIGDNAGRTRVIASFGNTLNFGGYMVMAIPATLSMAYLKMSGDRRWFAILVAALGLQIAGIWFSGGRGPFVGLAVGLVMFFVLAVIVLDLRKVAQAVAVFITASVIAAFIIALPSPQGDIGLERALSIGTQLQAPTTSDSTEIEAGLTGRFQIWRSVLKLATTWQVPEPEPITTRVLRPVFGVGPDMLIYSFPLVGEPQTKLHSVDHAHNYPLQILAEQGYAGFLLLVGASLLLVVAAFRTVRTLKARASEIQPWQMLLLALLPATAGKLAELQTGVGRISDMTMTFAIMAGVLVLYELIVARSAEAEAETDDAARRAVRVPRELMIGSTLLAAVVVTATLFTLFIGWDVRRLSASRLLATTYDNPARSIRAQGWADSQDQAPERESFTHGLANAYLIEADKAQVQGDMVQAVGLIEKSRELLLEYEEFDPFEWDVQMLLAKTVSRLVTWGELQYTREMAERYIRTAELYPAYPSILGTAATALTSVDFHEEAIYYADKAISMEANTQPWSKAWYAKGRALYELNREDEAIAALITATEKQPGWEGALLSHQVLSEIYRIQGKDELSDFHAEEGSGPILFEED
ncbi:MAG: O-antigen ligase family protein [Dehalococcoidia bacterium]|jgi:O-antigen ligase|nr:O-antigen ligase family protein [Dehalococcoidia bacterium]